jgi:hypothetical protein
MQLVVGFMFMRVLVYGAIRMQLFTFMPDVVNCNKAAHWLG